jgi:16S rRNA (cytidine1402-2'-O)-methyltransferase
MEVETLPGPTAFVPALVNSGFPCDRFCFEGFLPHKKGRVTRITEWLTEERTIILYESPHRLVKTLQQMNDILGPDREVCVCRELTKMYEEVKRGKISDLLLHYTNTPPKGEIVMLLRGCS